MVLGRRMQRRLVIAGLAGLLAAPAFPIAPASAAILFTCDSVTGSAVVSPGLVHDERDQSLSSGPTAPAGSADITLASTSDAGVKGNGTSGGASLSADGTRVAFPSLATNLDPADTDGEYDVYVKDLTTGDITLASTSDTGVKSNGYSPFRRPGARRVEEGHRAADHPWVGPLPLTPDICHGRSDSRDAFGVRPTGG
jgi:hypothetical protein